MKIVKLEKLNTEDIKSFIEFLNKEENIDEPIESVSTIKQDKYGTYYIEVNGEEIPLCVFADVIKRLSVEKYAVYLVTYYTQYENCVMEVYNNFDECVSKCSGKDEAYAVVSWFIRKHIQKKGKKNENI